MTPDRELDKMVDADIEDWMEARENEGHKWGEAKQTDFLKCMVCEGGELEGRFCNECGAETDI